MASTLILGGLVACVGDKIFDSQETAAAVDADGDGFFGDDCDDDDAKVNPDATEECEDLVDNDCDGLVDFDDQDDCFVGR